jgi:DNA-binding response OmpR family regulator
VRRLRALIVEDSEEWRSGLALVAKKGGFEATTAADLEEARQRLAHDFFHLLLLDIRLEANDPDNNDGMTLLEEMARTGLTAATGVIVLSAFGTMDQQREAFRDFDVLDFIHKRNFHYKELLAEIQNLLAKLQINLTLNIHWQGLSGPEEVVLGLQLGEARITRSEKRRPLLVRAALELDDLLCRLFHEAETVLISPLPGGRGTGGILLVRPTFPELGAGQPRIVKFADAATIQGEAEHYEKYVSHFVEAGRSTHLEARRRTSLLGGLSYTLVGADGEAFRTWNAFYERADTEPIRLTLENLFFRTCGPWYASTSPLQPVDLSAEYAHMLGFSRENLSHARDKLAFTIQGSDEWTFTALDTDRRFANPLTVLDKPPLIRMTYLCTTHGDLHGGNIIVDESSNSWLVDFARTGPGHILRDLAELDSAVRFELLGETEADLKERFLLEEVLLGWNPYKSSEPRELNSANPHLAKAFSTCVRIRQIAARQVERNSQADISEFHIASLFLALNWTRFLQYSKTQREHAFLSAAMIAEKRYS